MICPRTKVILLLMVGLLAIVLEHATSLTLLTLFAFVAVMRVNLNPKWLRNGLVIILGLTWSTVISQSLFYGVEPRTAWFSLGPFVFWLEGLEHGLVQSLRLVAVALAGIAVTISTPPDKLLLALQRLGIPPGICFLAVTALRFIPTIAGEVVDVRTARKHRGRAIWRRHPWAWLKQEISLLRPIVARTLRRSRTLAESLDARGYSPGKPRMLHQSLEWSGTDALLLGTFGTLSLALLSARMVYLLYVWDLAYHPALRPLYGVVRRWI